MSGMINLSLTQQLDEYGNPLSGGQMYFIQAGTVATPQNAYQDELLTIPLPNPIVLDAAGRVPQFFLADGQIKVRLQDVNGIVKFVADNLLVLGPSSSGGGGGGGAVDPTTVLSTGDIKARYDTSILTGWVRCNGNSIGSVTSGATELADISAQALFQYLWTADATLTVSGGRGASSIADWTANKRLSLPDMRSRLLCGIDGMGAVNNNLLAGSAFGKGNATTMGSFGGAYSRAIPSASLPSHFHAVALADPGHFHSYTMPTTPTTAQGGGAALSAGTTTGNTSSAPTGAYISSPNGINTSYSAGGGSAMDMTPAFMLITVYMKL